MRHPRNEQGTVRNTRFVRRSGHDLHAHVSRREVTAHSRKVVDSASRNLFRQNDFVTHFQIKAAAQGIAPEKTD